jgi:hypothetical protein
MITSSGDVVEDAQAVTDPAQRRARDETLRTIFADPTSRHHEIIAEAELDIDYHGSPIVMGDDNGALAPGQRMPDTIDVALADARAGMLHELAHRAGHTALLLGGVSAPAEELVRLDNAIRAQSDPSIIEASVVLATRSEDRQPCARLAPEATERLGISEVTLLVVRPDGHVGLRADRDHVAAMAAYHKLLLSGPA